MSGEIRRKKFFTRSIAGFVKEESDEGGGIEKVVVEVARERMNFIKDEYVSELLKASISEAVYTH